MREACRFMNEKAEIVHRVKTALPSQVETIHDLADIATACSARCECGAWAERGIPVHSDMYLIKRGDQWVMLAIVESPFGKMPGFEVPL